MPRVLRRPERLHPLLLTLDLTAKPVALVGEFGVLVVDRVLELGEVGGWQRYVFRGG